MALFNRKMDQWEDPEILLDQARRDMAEAHSKNRERAIQAITQKNNLQAMVEKEQSECNRLEKLAETALKQGNRDLARQLLQEKMSHQQALTGLQTSLTSAQQTVDQVKIAIQREDEVIRQRTAQALALKAKWKQAQIQNAIQKALGGMEFDQTMQSWGLAEEKIQHAQSEASARTEMYSESIDGKIAALQTASASTEADVELEKMEQRLGMAPAPSVLTEEQTVVAGQALPTAENPVDKELKELEIRLGPQEPKQE